MKASEFSALVLGAALLVPASVVAQGSPDSLPAGVTPAMVEEGATLYSGAGICFACHGPDGRGTTGPDLTDDEWVHSNGSFEAIIRQILTGVPIERAKSGIPMAPKGGVQLTDEQVRAVAAYVWSLRLKRER